jgi:hypothetical protein
MPPLFANLCPVTLLAVIPLIACATGPPPYATNVRAWPRAGESVDQFEADDLACRTYMQTHTPPPGAPQVWSTARRLAAARALPTPSFEGAHSPSDVAYAQCMKSKGYVVENTNWMNAVIAPPRYGSGYGYGSAYTHDYPDDADAQPGGYSYYVTYPYAVGTLPFFFFVRHHHDGSHH